MSASLSGATVTVSTDFTREAPLLAYNIGNFWPGSNTIDWWRYSEVAGARIFLAPSHFKVSGSERPGESAIASEAQFLARKEALRADPLNTDFINWPLIEGRFNVPLSGNNRVVPGYALQQIHQSGGAILAQMTVSESAFPLVGSNDWAGKWIIWRTFYSVAFYMAREFDVERIGSHNEPNHPKSFIEPIPWFLRLRIASDAMQAAIEDVNRLYGKSLQPRMVAPVSAGTTGSGYRDYGQSALANIDIDFLNRKRTDFQSFHMYAYQTYSSVTSNSTADFETIRNGIRSLLPDGIDPLPIAITEFNVHTGANYDSMRESSDTLSKAVRFGEIIRNYTAIGVDELFAFKFGMTNYSGNFPVQKNGMLFTDNTNAPYNYGTMSRSAEVYRLFNKGFGRGRMLLEHSVSGTGAGELEVLVSKDPDSGFVAIFSVNESGSSQALEIDLSALLVADGNQAIVEDVSQWRTGTIRSIETVNGGLLQPGSQPNQTVWLITVPTGEQRSDQSNRVLQEIPAGNALMVRDGSFAESSLAPGPPAYTRAGSTNPDERAAVFLQFDLPDDWKADELLLAVLSLPVAPLQGGSGAVHAHLYGIDEHGWADADLTWRNAPNLRQFAFPGNQIRHGVVSGAGETAHILGQLVTSEQATRQIDVTRYLVRQSSGKASFLVAQVPRWDVDINVSSIPASHAEFAVGDTQSDALRIFTTADAGYAGQGPVLKLIRREPQPVSYLEWIEEFFPAEDARAAPSANPAGDGFPNLLKFALGMDPRVKSAASLLQQNSESDTVAFGFTLNPLAEGVDLVVETSSNLQQWSALQSPPVADPDNNSVEVQLPLPGTPPLPATFIRLRATLSQ